MKIQSLLNPLCGNERNDYRSSESPLPAPAQVSYPVAQYSSVPKRQKIPKDAPIFSEGTKVVGHMNFPPYEGQEDKELMEEYRRFQLFPMGEIYRKGVRHIPYNSDKKDFLEKTGRESFEMFQYTYKIPHQEKEYVVVWDYNVGLVRMTPFFKSLQHSKTVPAKALRENPGLKDISYSITGGALVCQGYWMPYQAAKAMAATFCWHIRWVLTPIFGYDFPESCLPPDDSGYGKFLIDPKIVQECIAETNRFRQEGYDYRVQCDKESVTIEAPQLSTLTAAFVPTVPQRNSEESGYYTDGDQNEGLAVSPQISPRGSTWMSAWTSVNGSVSPSSSSIILSPALDRMSNEVSAIPRPLRVVGFPFNPHPTSVPTAYDKDRFPTKRLHSEIVEDSDFKPNPAGAHATVSSPQPINHPGSRDSHDCGRNIKELEAAEIILRLSAVDQTLPAPKRTRRGSRY